MKVLSVILGVIMVICGFSCAFTPLKTLLSAGYLIAIMMFVYGIGGIVRSVSLKRYGLAFAVSIIAVVIGVIALFKPGTTLVIDAMIIYMTAAFFLIQGAVCIVTALNLKKLMGGKQWIWVLVFGILAVILGIISFMNPLFTAETVGFLIGFYFVESGFNMIVLALAQPKEGGLGPV